MDLLLTESTRVVDSFSIREKAARGLLDDKLSIDDIAELCCQSESEKKRYITALIELCKSDCIKYYGNIRGCEWKAIDGNPYPGVKRHSVDLGDPMRTAVYDLWKSKSADCLISKNDFEVYLKSVKQWPVKDVLLRHWFGFERRRYIPVDRKGASESLAMIDEVVSERGVKYYDELEGGEFWGLLVLGEIENDRIKEFPKSEKGILRMNDGKPIRRSEFMKQFNNRFEKIK